MAEGAGLLNRYTAKSRIGGSNPPLSATLILKGFVGFRSKWQHLVATNPPLFGGVYQCQLRAAFDSFSHCSMKARMLARWKRRTPLIRPGSRMDTDRM